MANLQNQKVNHNLKDFRLEMRDTNVTVYPDMLPYSSPNKKMAGGCIPDAMAIINRQVSQSNAYVPRGGNTPVLKPQEDR